MLVFEQITAYMTNRRKQELHVPREPTVQMSPEMRLANADRERLWIGLERFVNCGDSESDYSSLSHNFPNFWPIGIWHFPGRDSRYEPEFDSRPKTSSNLDRGCNRKEETLESLDWHPACHGLFLLYRNALRHLWGDGSDEFLDAGALPEELLLGTSNLVESLFADARILLHDPQAEFPRVCVPSELSELCETIFRKFPSVQALGAVPLFGKWGTGNFSLYPNDDFHKAFYLLFRQSWRARVCRHCCKFFVARKPKQLFCGNVCSAAKRAESKLKWWNKNGAKRRAALLAAKPKRSRRNRKGRNK
jgi:hypothetical protein